MERSIPSLIEELGGLGSFARIIGKGYSTASEMKRTGSIQVRYWPLIIAAAEARGLSWVTPDALLQLHVRVEAAE